MWIIAYIISLNKFGILIYLKKLLHICTFRYQEKKSLPWIALYPGNLLTMKSWNLLHGINRGWGLLVLFVLWDKVEHGLELWCVRLKLLLRPPQRLFCLRLFRHLEEVMVHEPLSTFTPHLDVSLLTFKQ
jgi:hypothetical protein